MVRLLAASAVGGWLAGVAVLFAQAGTPIRALEIALWPEYDDPRVLVILTGTLEPGEGILSLPLPEGADLNAVAFAEVGVSLTNAEWEVETSGGASTLIVQLPAPRFQVEYYLDAVESGEDTLVSVEIPVPDAPVGEARLVVQQPAQAASLSGDPAVGEPQLGFAGLTYFSRDLGSLSGGDVVRQQVRYVRLAPGLSTQPSSPPPGSPAPAATDGPDWRLLGAAAAVAVGVASLGLWLWRGGGLSAVSERVRPRPGPPAGYCHNCGHPFQPGDRYCAQCGTARRS